MPARPAAFSSTTRPSIRAAAATGVTQHERREPRCAALGHRAAVSIALAATTLPAVVLDHEVAGRITLRERLAGPMRVRDRAAVRIDDLALQVPGLPSAVRARSRVPTRRDRAAVGDALARRAGQRLGAANGTCGEREVAVRATARDDRLFAGSVADSRRRLRRSAGHDLQRGFGNRLAGPVAHVASEPHGWCTTTSRRCRTAAHDATEHGERLARRRARAAFLRPLKRRERARRQRRRAGRRPSRSHRVKGGRRRRRRAPRSGDFRPRGRAALRARTRRRRYVRPSRSSTMRCVPLRWSRAAQVCRARSGAQSQANAFRSTLPPNRRRRPRRPPATWCSSREFRET